MMKVGNEPKFQKLAATLGTTLAQNNIRLVYGGGSIGLMGIIARATLSAGGNVTGVIPGHLDRVEISQDGLTELHVVPNMHIRKRKMFDLSDAFVILPGSIGTLDETIEVITWAQLNLHDKPIILVNVDNYWQPFLDLLEHIIGKGFMTESTLDLFHVINDIETLLPTLNTLPSPQIDPKNTLF